MSAPELEQLHKAIEAVMPPEVRTTAVAARKAVEQVEREEERRERAAKRDEDRKLARQEREARREEDRRERVTATEFEVAGVAYENRQAAHRAYSRIGAEILLERDPENPHSGRGTAIRVLATSGAELGFVPGSASSWLAEELDEGVQYSANIAAISGEDPMRVMVVVRLCAAGGEGMRAATVRRGYWAALARRKRMKTWAVVGAIALVVLVLLAIAFGG